MQGCILHKRYRYFCIAFWLARRMAPGLGYGRCWNRGPPAVVSAARGCVPSSPVLQPPFGASLYADGSCEKGAQCVNVAPVSAGRLITMNVTPCAIAAQLPALAAPRSARCVQHQNKLTEQRLFAGLP